MLKSAFGRLSTGVCRQPQWAYVGVFMYFIGRVAALSFLRIMLRHVQTAAVGLCRGVYVFIARVERIMLRWVQTAAVGFMSGCLCIHRPGGALSLQRFMLRRVQTAAVGLCRGVYVFIGRVQRIMLRHVQTAAVGLCRGVYVFIGWVQRIMLRRVQTAAVDLCRGVYVFIGWVQPVLWSELYLIIHAEMPLRLFMDFSAGCLCIFNRNITASQEKLYLILRAALTPT